jgi:hypothetical protein
MRSEALLNTPTGTHVIAVRTAASSLPLADREIASHRFRSTYTTRGHSRIPPVASITTKSWASTPNLCETMPLTDSFGNRLHIRKLRFLATRSLHPTPIPSLSRCVRERDFLPMVNAGASHKPKPAELGTYWRWSRGSAPLTRRYLSCFTSISTRYDYRTRKFILRRFTSAVIGGILSPQEDRNGLLSNGGILARQRREDTNRLGSNITVKCRGRDFGKYG